MLSFNTKKDLRVESNEKIVLTETINDDVECIEYTSVYLDGKLLYTFETVKESDCGFTIRWFTTKK